MPAGRKQHAPTIELRSDVKSMASFGYPHDAIAKKIGIAKATLEKHYKEELKNAKQNLDLKVKEFNAFLASGDALEHGASWDVCSKANMFYLKTQCGYRETQQIDNTSSDGSMSTPTNIQVNLVKSKKNDES